MRVSVRAPNNAAAPFFSVVSLPPQFVIAAADAAVVAATAAHLGIERGRTHTERVFISDELIKSNVYLIYVISPV